MHADEGAKPATRFMFKVDPRASDLIRVQNISLSLFGLSTMTRLGISKVSKLQSFSPDPKFSKFSNTPSGSRSVYRDRDKGDAGDTAWFFFGYHYYWGNKTAATGRYRFSKGTLERIQTT
jgi:hypothetical protein